MRNHWKMPTAVFVGTCCAILAAVALSGCDSATAADPSAPQAWQPVHLSGTVSTLYLSTRCEAGQLYYKATVKPVSKLIRENIFGPSSVGLTLEMQDKDQFKLGEVKIECGSMKLEKVDDKGTVGLTAAGSVPLSEAAYEKIHLWGIYCPDLQALDQKGQ